MSACDYDDGSNSDKEKEAISTEVEEEDPHVVSEVNTFLVSSSDISPIVRNRNLVARLSFSRPVSQDNGRTENAVETSSGNDLQFDEDGDAVLPNRYYGKQLDELTLHIEYENSTSLSLVGLQIWRGAFVLADFIIHNAAKLFIGENVLELGSGTGISSVVASFYASKVMSTDLNEPDILKLIEANFHHNRKYVKSGITVRALDFLNLAWSQDVENYVSEADVILAADVVYHDTITKGFVQTLKKCLTTGKPKNVFIALEKRYVFTISDLDVVAPMYDNFMELLQTMLALSPSPEEVSSSPSSGLVVPGVSNQEPGAEAILTSVIPQYNLVPVSLDFPQYFSYERTKELVIWNIHPTC